MGWDGQHFVCYPVFFFLSRAHGVEVLGNMYDCNGQISFFQMVLDQHNPRKGSSLSERNFLLQ